MTRMCTVLARFKASEHIFRSNTKLLLYNVILAELATIDRYHVVLLVCLNHVGTEKKNTIY